MHKGGAYVDVHVNVHEIFRTESSTTRLPPFGRLNDRTGKGGLVGWSVGQFLCTHLFVCGVMMKWYVCSDWLIEKKNK